MIYEAFKKALDNITYLTPNYFIPQLGAKVTNGKVEVYVFAEIYLFLRFIFSLIAISFLSKQSFIAYLMVLIQLSSFLYLLKILFPTAQRTLKDPERSLFFALGHYIELGLCMAYIYWVWGSFNVSDLSRIDAIYYSFVTMTTVGYGDILPKTELTKLLAVFQMLAGMFMFVVVIGLFLNKSSEK